MKQIDVLQAHYYPQQSIIVQKELTKFTTITSVTFPLCAELNFTCKPIKPNKSYDEQFTLLTNQY